MEWALYHPAWGYYCSGAVRIGTENSDFITAPHLSGAFAGCLGRFVSAADAALGSPRDFVLVEGGPGEGLLARSLLDILRCAHPDLYARLKYFPHEISDALRRRQTKVLEAHRTKVLQDMAAARGVAGVYLSNELVDAFPVHRVVRKGEQYLEVFVDVAPEGFKEVLLPPRDGRVLLAALERTPQLDNGCEMTVNLKAETWMATVASCLAEGFVLTIDYGDEEGALPGGLCGTGPACTSFARHRSSNDVLADAGQRDLTARVNFSALVRAGQAHGLASAPLMTQKDFLLRFGILEEAMALEDLGGHNTAEMIEARHALGQLLMPSPAMGTSFKALIQAKNVSLDDLCLDRQPIPPDLFA